MNSGRVVAIKRSIKKGAPKEIIEAGTFIKDFGLEGDLHGGQAGRQVTLMGIDTVQAIKKSEIKGLCTNKFVETITIQGIDLWKIDVGTCIGMGEIVLRITRIGKECFPGCPIREKGASCLLLTQVVFADVVKGGLLKKGDVIDILDEGNGHDQV
jgi:MOSC domain-containing protein YiiM